MKTKSLWSLIAMGLCLVFAQGVAAQPVIGRDGGSETDKPTKPVSVRIPHAPIGDNDDTPDGEVKEDGDGQGEDGDPDIEDDDALTFFGEKVNGNFVLCLDRSGSMAESDNGSGPIQDWNGNVISNPSRLIVVKTEAIKLIMRLKKENEFAIVSFGGG